MQKKEMPGENIPVLADDPRPNFSANE